jgi:hypothetical protein
MTSRDAKLCNESVIKYMGIADPQTKWWILVDFRDPGAPEASRIPIHGSSFRRAPKIHTHGPI